MNIQDQFIEIKKIMQNNGTLQDEYLIDQSFMLAKQVHYGQFRKSGEPYIIHPIKVASILARLQMNQDIVCAALLHDVIEDGKGEFAYTKEKLAKKISPHIAELVEAVSAFKRDADHKMLSKEELDKASLNKFIQEAHRCPEAFYIKLADRLHNLSTLDAMPYCKQIGKVRETRKLLLPIAQALHANYFQSRIENLCFKYENPEQYTILSKVYFDTLLQNSFSIIKFEYEFDSLTSGVLDEKFEHFVNELSLSQVFTHFYVYKRNLSSIYYEMVPFTSNISSLDISFIEDEIPIMNFNLFVNEKVKENRVHLFFKFYKEYLYDEGYIWIENGKDIINQYPYILLKDNYDVIYKIYLLTKKESHQMDVGNIGNLNRRTFYNVDEYLNDAIEIFKRNGSKSTVVKGSTALDLAFEIYKEKGIYAYYAIINGVIPEDERLKKESLFQSLNYGDQIEIVMDETVHVTPNWFLYARTFKAKSLLVDYFNNLT